MPDNPTTKTPPLGVVVTDHFHHRPMPLAAVLSALSSQENADGDEGNAMAMARAVLGKVWDIARDSPEPNMSNLDLDEVSRLNVAMTEIYLLLQPVMEIDNG